MKLGVFTVPLHNKTLEETLQYLSGLGVQTVEIGAGGYPGSKHLDITEIINGNGAEEVLHLLSKYNMSISAISVHGNPVHPNKEIAKKFHDEFLDAVLVCEKLGVDTVITFSGCPGDCENSKYPNWVTCAWPPDFGEIQKWQWEEVLIPYWKKAADYCKTHGVTKIALEMHPGFAVYNTSSLLRLREEVGDIIGANFDPSHLIWQGMDPVESIKALKGAIHHFHAKDTRVDNYNNAINGVLDTGKYTDPLTRSWIFRTVGYGSTPNVWKDIMSTLAAIGYDGAVSIEHEDALMSVTEGLEKAIDFLKKVMIFEKAGDAWWD